ncbi:2-succinyl-5-enolpyruvyl-6-hydroxy-3-cyclohexene-1-carboxylic-acid synthase [Bacillaceae bacterium W0354]
MNMGDKTYYVTNFVSELAHNGLEDVVISPGSRSTPLAMTFAEHPHVKEWIHFDERSAAFFALGIAKKKNKPVALVCTSGTAATNYYPAIVEAYYSRVPLIVLTADRPHELRDNGAPQAIDQIKMYQNYTKYFHEMALPEASKTMIRYARRQASRAYHIANSSCKGVVHLNFPFRDPLIPDLSLNDLWGETEHLALSHSTTEERVTSVESDAIVQSIKGLSRGLIVCGEIKTEPERKAILSLAEELRIPVLADVLSNLRKSEAVNEYVISTYDTILKDDHLKEILQPEFIIRFGSMPVSKPYLQWITNWTPQVHIVVDENLGFREPAGINTLMVYNETISFVQTLKDCKGNINISDEWTKQWLKFDENVRQVLTTIKDEHLTEGTAALTLSESSGSGDIIFVGSSMPIRDMDTFYLPSQTTVELMANRGVNGIDGVISTAIGVASTNKQTTLMIGDVSFLHDYMGLFIARQYDIPIRIIVMNNNGGGIFSFLPQSTEKKHFEALFGTPFNPPIKKLSEAVDAHYENPKTISQLKEVIQSPIRGIEIIEVVTDREENVVWHREKWEEASKRLKELLDADS